MDHFVYCLVMLMQVKSCESVRWWRPWSYMLRTLLHAQAHMLAVLQRLVRFTLLRNVQWRSSELSMIYTTPPLLDVLLGVSWQWSKVPLQCVGAVRRSAHFPLRLITIWAIEAATLIQRTGRHLSKVTCNSCRTVYVTSLLEKITHWFCADVSSSYTCAISMGSIFATYGLSIQCI